VLETGLTINLDKTCCYKTTGKTNMRRLGRVSISVVRRVGTVNKLLSEAIHAAIPSVRSTSTAGACAVEAFQAVIDDAIGNAANDAKTTSHLVYKADFINCR